MVSIDWIVFVIGFILGFIAGAMIAQTLILQAHGQLFTTFPSSCHAGIMPDKHCTPGQTDPMIGENNIHQTICATGYAVNVSSYTKLVKPQLMHAYHLNATNVILDHLIPIVDGGNPYSLKNIWPEPIHGKYNAHDKDGLEALVHRSLCDGKITLSTAEHLFSNWISVWKKNHMPRTNQTID